jgi:hypothetical protein
MISLTLSNAFEFVRKSLDELDLDNNIGESVLQEDKDLYQLIESTIEEVVLDVHQKAPAILVDGITAEISKTSEDEPSVVEDTQDTVATMTVADTVATIEMKKDTARIVSLQAEDSSVVVTELLAEDSAEAHKQNDKYIRGTADSPRAVLLKKGAGNKLPKIKYYTLTDDSKKITIEYVPYPEIKDNAINVSWQLYYPVLNWLVAAILEIVNEPEKAQIWKLKFKTEQ